MWRKELKLKVKKFMGLIATFAEQYRGKTSMVGRYLFGALMQCSFFKLFLFVYLLNTLRKCIFYLHNICLGKLAKKSLINYLSFIYIITHIDFTRYHTMNYLIYLLQWFWEYLWSSIENSHWWFSKRLAGQTCSLKLGLF